MSAKERDRLKVISALVKEPSGNKLTQAQAAQMLNCSERHVGRLVQRYRKEGDAGLIHKARGRPSNRRYSDRFRQEALAIVREQYHDFGPTLAAEKLAQDHDITVSRETLRKWMSNAGLWKPKARKATHRQWRERKPCFGEMVQIDTSIHDWLEGRGEEAVLISIIDDATSSAYMRFFPSDTTAANMTLLRDYIRRYGRPLAVYGDRAGHFVSNREPDIDEQLADAQPLTQIGRALAELDIQWISANSPQAKGRVERSFCTAQDRLVKELRLAGASTIAQANRVLQDSYLPHWQEHFTVAPACALDVHRHGEDFDLDAIFSRQEKRVVMRDYTIQFANRRYQISKACAKPGLVGDTVIVEQRLDDTLHLRWRGEYLEFEPVTVVEPADAAALPLGLRPRSRATAKGTAVTPKADHPWKQGFPARQDKQRRRQQQKPRPNTRPR